MQILKRRCAPGLPSTLELQSPPADDPAQRPPKPVPPPPTHPANYEVRMIEAAPGVSLEVLDFGGTGAPVVFLAGLGLTAHVYEDFAPRLTEQHRVYAITRRGFGASSEPDSGYDLPTRVADDIAVLDALGHESVIWIGHSMAGDELNGLAATHPKRVSKLVYIDATCDHGEGLQKLINSLPPPLKVPAPTRDEWDDPVKLESWLDELLGTKLPLGEVLAELVLSPDAPPRRRAYPQADSEMIKAAPPMDFTDVDAPALVLVAPPDGPQSEHGYDKMSPEQQEAWREAWPRVVAFLDASYENVRKNLAGVDFVAIHHSNHFMFIRSADEVFAKIQAFLGSE